MTAKTYLLARWNQGAPPRPVELGQWREAHEFAAVVHLVAATSARHARNLVLEGVEAVRGMDGHIERCGILTDEGPLPL